MYIQVHLKDIDKNDTFVMHGDYISSRIRTAEGIRYRAPSAEEEIQVSIMNEME